MGVLWDGADEEALSWLTEQSQKDTRSGRIPTFARWPIRPPPSISTGTLVGSYASVARMLDEVAAVPECGRRSADLHDDFTHRRGNLRRAHPATDAVPRPHPCRHERRWRNDDLKRSPGSCTFRAPAGALIVVDMQNAYASRAVYLDLAGFDVSRHPTR